jgi:hypothetical protein
MQMHEHTSELLWERLFALRPKDELIALVHRQLSADFERAGHSLDFAADLAPGLWAGKIFENLKGEPPETVAQLIYLIDMPETLVLEMHRDPNYLRQLSEAILYRELVKVYYKITYSA